MDYQAILYDPIYLTQGTSAVMTLVDSRQFEFTALDKTTGVDVGEDVTTPTIAPAACLRVREVLAAGLELSNLHHALLVMNDVTWRVVNYKLRPSPRGEDDGEILLVLVEKPAPPKLVAASFVDESAFSVVMEPVFGGVFRDQSQLGAILTVEAGMEAAFTDEAIFSAEVRTGIPFASTTFVDATDCALAVTRPIRIRGAFVDDTDITAVLARIYALRASFADAGGFNGAITLASPFIATYLDESIFTAALDTAQPLQAVNFLDQSLFGADLRSTPTLKASFADQSDFDGALEIEAASMSVMFLDGRSESHSASKTHTFSGVPFGTPHANRYIVVAITASSNVSANAITDCTIGGVTATIINAPAGTTSWLAIAYARVPTGTSGNIVFTTNVTFATRAKMAAYRVVPIGGTGIALLDTGGISMGDPFSDILATEENSFVLCAAATQSGTTLSGCTAAGKSTADYSDTLNGQFRVVGEVADSTSELVSADASNVLLRAVAASFRITG